MKSAEGQRLKCEGCAERQLVMRLLVHVEGETEESFVNEVLASYLVDHGYSAVSARIVGNARQRIRRGGIQSWPVVRKGIANHLKSDRRCAATTMVDYYGLPRDGQDAWPGRRKAVELSFEQRAEHVEGACARDMEAHFGIDLRRRFVPFVMIHEFEALLFSDCRSFAEGIGQPNAANELQRIRRRFRTPEEIDDSPEGAPSKRIQRMFPGYQKPLMGTLAALEIGISTMRDACPHFANWLERLTRLAANRPG